MIYRLLADMTPWRWEGFCDNISSLRAARFNFRFEGLLIEIALPNEFSDSNAVSHWFVGALKIPVVGWELPFGFMCLVQSFWRSERRKKTVRLKLNYISLTFKKSNRKHNFKVSKRALGPKKDMPKLFKQVKSHWENLLFGLPFVFLYYS